jgi:hypothetical protein
MMTLLVMLYVDLLLGNDREVRKYTTIVNRQRPVNRNKGTMFSMRSVPIGYKRKS